MMSFRHRLVGPLCGAALMMLPALCQGMAAACDAQSCKGTLLRLL
jgi:hypothetical protein